MKRTFRTIALAAGVAATMAFVGAAPGLGKAPGPKPPVVTGNPGKGATVIHCKRLAPAGKGVTVITPKGKKVKSNCALPQGTVLPPKALPGNVLALLRNLVPAQQAKLPQPIKELL